MLREQTAKPTEVSPSHTSRSADRTQEFTWISSRTHTNMGSTSHRACFLSRVAGHFGTDRYVRTTADFKLIVSNRKRAWIGRADKAPLAIRRLQCSRRIPG